MVNITPQIMCEGMRADFIAVDALSQRLIERAHPLHPPEHVAAAVPTREATVAAHREEHPASRRQQVLHDLTAGGARADDQQLQEIFGMKRLLVGMRRGRGAYLAVTPRKLSRGKASTLKLTAWPTLICPTSLSSVAT